MQMLQHRGQAHALSAALFLSLLVLVPPRRLVGCRIRVLSGRGFELPRHGCRVGRRGNRLDYRRARRLVHQDAERTGRHLSRPLLRRLAGDPARPGRGQRPVRRCKHLSQGRRRPAPRRDHPRGGGARTSSSCRSEATTATRSRSTLRAPAHPASRWRAACRPTHPRSHATTGRSSGASTASAQVCRRRCGSTSPTTLSWAGPRGTDGDVRGGLLPPGGRGGDRLASARRGHHACASTTSTSSAEPTGFSTPRRTSVPTTRTQETPASAVAETLWSWTSRSFDDPGRTTGSRWSLTTVPGHEHPEEPRTRSGGRRGPCDDDRLHVGMLGRRPAAPGGSGNTRA